MKLNLNLPIPAGNSEALPDCPSPKDNLEALIRIDGKDARIGFAASYYAADIAGAPRTCRVRAGVFPLLRRAAGLLPGGYSLLIFDAYRPLAVQQALYDAAAAEVRRLHPAYTPAQVAAASKMRQFSRCSIPSNVLQITASIKIPSFAVSSKRPKMPRARFLRLLWGLHFGRSPFEINGSELP